MAAKEATVKELMAFFDTPTRPMTAKEMVREWKSLSDEAKLQIKRGIADDTLTY